MFECVPPRGDGGLESGKISRMRGDIRLEAGRCEMLVDVVSSVMYEMAGEERRSLKAKIAKMCIGWRLRSVKIERNGTASLEVSGVRRDYIFMSFKVVTSFRLKGGDTEKSRVVSSQKSPEFESQHNH